MNNVFSTPIPRWLGPITIANAVATGMLLLFFFFGLSSSDAKQSNTAQGPSSSPAATGSAAQSGANTLPKQVGGC